MADRPNTARADGARAEGARDDARPADPAESPTARKDPSEWKTGDEPMTGPQASYLKTLAHEAGEDYDPELTKAEASERIDELQHETGRSGG